MFVDNNDNKSTINIVAKIDLGAPTCTVNYDYKTNKVILESKNDTLSGIKEYGLVKSSNVNYNSKTSIEFSTGTFYGYVKDNVGNTSSCNKKFDFTPHYRIGTTLYETLNTALEGASKTGSIIYLLMDYTDKSVASTDKTVTLNLDNKTLTRTQSINSTGGTFTLKNGLIAMSTEKVDILDGSGGNIKIDSVKMDCKQNCVYMKSKEQKTGYLTVNKSNLIADTGHSIRFMTGGNITVTDSFLYISKKSESVISVGNNAGNITVNGSSLIGMGYIDEEGMTSGRSIIGAGIATTTEGSTVTLSGNAKIIIGKYGGDGIFTDAKTTVNVTGNASIYTIGNGNDITRACVSISENGTGSVINLNTSGYLYANGYNTALIKNTTGTINYNKGHFVSKKDHYMFGYNNQRYCDNSIGPQEIAFEQIKNTNGEITTSKQTGCYYYEKGV